MKPRYGHFNWIAPFYDSIFGHAHHDLLFARLEARPGHFVLDIGGGTGRVAAALRDLGAQVVVVDPSMPMLVKARAKGLPAVRAIAEQLPFRTASVDRAFVVDAFHHFADHDLAASELLRALGPQARMVIEEPDIRKAAVKLLALAERLALMQSRFLSPSDARELFAGHGATVETSVAELLSVHMIVEV